MTGHRLCEPKASPDGLPPELRFVPHLGLAESAPGTRTVEFAAAVEGLDRIARPAFTGGPGVDYAFAWDRDDFHDPHWWPQGLTTAPASSRWRNVMISSAYRKGHTATRVSLIDLGDPERVRYTHIRLVVDQPGSTTPELVKVHAGGLVWAGNLLHVAATAQGLLTFDLTNLRLGLDGHLELPLSHRLVSAGSKMRWSFISLDELDLERPQLIAGEYGRGRAPRRLAEFDMSPEGWPGRYGRWLIDEGPLSMQGAARNDSGLVIAASRGATRRSDLWLHGPTGFTRHAGELPVGAEDVTRDPATAAFWSLSEHPGMRWVFRLAHPG